MPQTENPLISVVTICRNAAHEIERTAASVAAQSDVDGCVEHLLIDGASTDETVPLARRAGRPDMRIVSEPDHGLYDAMNKGLRLARGRYVIFLNAGDTFADASTLSAYRDAAMGDADIIYADTVVVDDEGNVLRPRHLSVPERLTRASFKHGMLVCHQAFMVRRDLAPLYDTRYRFSADYDWCISCIEKSRPDNNVNLKRVAIHYLDAGLTDRNHKASLMERFHVMRRRYGVLTAVARHISFIPRAVAAKFSRR